MTQDVVVQYDFLDKLKSVTSVHARYKAAKDSYLSLKQRERHGSGITSSIDEVDMDCKTLARKLNDIADIQINLASILQPNGIRSAVDKREKMVIALTSMLSLIKPLQTVTRKLEVRVFQMKDTKEWGSGKKDGVQIDCINSMDLAWVEAMDTLIQGDDCTGPLSAEEVLRCAVAIEETNAMSLGELLLCAETTVTTSSAFLENQITVQFLSYLPVMSVKQGKTTVLVNLHELCLESDGKTFIDIINLDKHTDETDVQSTDTHSSDQSRPSFQSFGSKMGRPVLHDKYPDIVEKTVEFLQMHSFAAQERRRSSVSNASGVTLSDIRSHLLKTVPGLKDNGISRSTIQRLFYPPNKRHKSAKQYKRVVNARVPAKQNSRRSKTHTDTHFCRTQVNYCMEFTSKFNTEATSFSCDDKNKVNVGENTPAVSRYHHIGKFFMTGDSPNFCDHDFPIPNSKIVPSGYMELKPKYSTTQTRRSRSMSPARDLGLDRDTVRSRSVSPPRCQQDIDGQFKTDRLGRLHYSWPRTGPTTIVNRATKFHGSSMANHNEDLRPLIVNSKKSIVTLVLDNGPDQSTNSQKNLTMLGRLWRDTKLDVLQVCHYAPSDSALNPIEHQWSPRSRNLAGVFLKGRLDGEDKPPCDQSGLSTDQKREKEVKIYDRAVDDLNSYWNGQLFDGFPVVSIGVHADGGDNRDTIERVTQLHSVGIRKVTTEMRDLHQEHTFLNRHMDRRTHFVSFSKCESLSCLHCSVNPVKSTSAVAHLRQNGGMLSPLPSPWHADHYCTFLEAETFSALGKRAKRDQYCPTKMQSGVDQCELSCRYIFSSKADKTRHMMMCHHNWKSKACDDVPADRPVVKCYFVTDDGECGLIFSTRYQLSKHQDQTGHKMKRGRRPSKMDCN